jgi:hypothetical protein
MELDDDMIRLLGAIATANASLDLANIEEALSASKEALMLSRRLGDAPREMQAAYYVTLAHVISWNFTEAFAANDEMTATSLRLGSNAQASSWFVRAILCISLERWPQAEEALAEAAGGVKPDSDERPRGITPMLLELGLLLLRLNLDAKRGRWGDVLARRELFEQQAALFREWSWRDMAWLPCIDAMLARWNEADRRDVDVLLRRLTELPAWTDCMMWSDCRELAAFRIAARRRSSEAPELALQALTLLKSRAARIPHTSDWAFAKLAAAAREADLTEIALEADALAKRYRSARIAAAGDQWGNAAALASRSPD